MLNFLAAASSESEASSDENDSPSTWPCRLCAYSNPIYVYKCEVCELPRHQFTPSFFSEKSEREADFIARAQATKTSYKQQRREQRSKPSDDDFEVYWKDSQRANEWMASFPVREISLHELREEEEKKAEQQRQRETDPERGRDRFVFDPRIAKHLPSPGEILKAFRERNRELDFAVYAVLTPELLEKFEWSENLTMEYHGTSSENDESIRRRGLIPGGTEGVQIVNENFYGRGVYCSPCARTAEVFSQGSVYICLVSQFVDNGWCHVVRKKTQILPCYLVKMIGLRRDAWQREDELNNETVRFYPPRIVKGRNRLNERSTTRAVQRRFSWRNGYGNHPRAESEL